MPRLKLHVQNLIIKTDRASSIPVPNTNVLVLGNFVTHGSGEVFLRKFLSLLTPLSRRIIVFSDWDQKSGTEQFEVVNSVRSATRRFNEHTYFSRLIRYFLVQLILCFDLLRFASCPGIVVIFDTMMILPMLAAKLTGKKIILLVAGRIEIASSKPSNFQKSLIFGLLGFVKRTTFGLADRIIVESSSLVKWLNLGKYGGKTRIGPTFVNLDVFRFKDDVDSREEIVGYVGNLSEYKGILRFVSSIPIILDERPEVHFLIVGSGSCYEKIEQTITNMGLSDKVKLLGWLPNSGVSKTLSILKLMVIPSPSEGLPNILLESMACGTPVLATRVGGIPDIITDMKTGFIIDDNSPKSIADGTIKALNQQKLVEITQQAFTLVKSQYSFEAAVRRYDLILAGL